ncbi:MAG: SLBB domain-containing protein [Armatimonadetes bacterium]|nr:SLBB domain-containing protein [Armatimonadota bacterium]
MPRLLLVLFAALMATNLFAQGPSLLKAGDLLTVTTANRPQYSGDFLVGSDGSFTVQVLGRFEAAGRTLKDVEAGVRKRVREFVRDAEVTVILKQELPSFVYLVAPRVQDGAVIWIPGMTVRQLIGKYNDLQPLDSYAAKLYSQGQRAVDIDLVALMRQGDQSQDKELKPGDVLALLPAADKPVWVVGSVRTPGQVRLRSSEGVKEAIAAAGGASVSTSPAEMTVLLRRGLETFRSTLSEVSQREVWEVKDGDTIVVQAPLEVAVSVGGFVKKPGEVSVREGSPLMAAIVQAGGVEDQGTLERTLLFRSGEVRVFDARSLADGGTDPGAKVQSGDFVYVPENKRDYSVLGFVVKPGRKLIPDGRAVRLADALAAADGLAPRGTYRHAVVLRADGKGVYVAKRYDFDTYVKGGDVGQNPEILPGDIVFFDQVSGTNLGDLLRFLPNLLLFDRLF